MTDAVTLVYNRQQAALRRRAAQAVQLVYRNVTDYEDPEEWLESAAPVVGGVTSSAAALAQAWIAYKVGGTIIKLSEKATTPYRYEDRYTAPLLATWKSLGEGNPLPVAVDAGATRATEVVDMDAQWSSTRGAREQGDASGVTRWARVAEPEACELCLLAADKTYRTGDLAPIHRGCGCWVEPLTA